MNDQPQPIATNKELLKSMVKSYQDECPANYVHLRDLQIILGESDELFVSLVNDYNEMKPLSEAQINELKARLID